MRRSLQIELAAVISTVRSQLLGAVGRLSKSAAYLH